jgi:hypothetical protein
MRPEVIAAPTPWIWTSKSTDHLFGSRFTDELRTISDLPGSTMFANLQRNSVTDAVSTPTWSFLSIEMARANISVPCSIGAGNPYSSATRASVWMGFQIRAHSV